MKKQTKKNLGTAIGCLGILLIFGFLVKWMLPKDWDEDRRNRVSIQIIFILIVLLTIFGMFLEE